MKKEMTSKERVVAAIEFKGPDRLPHRHCYLPATLKRYPDIGKLPWENIKAILETFHRYGRYPIAMIDEEMK